jgi:hypothetical protein
MTAVACADCGKSTVTDRDDGLCADCHIDRVVYGGQKPSERTYLGHNRRAPVLGASDAQKHLIRALAKRHHNLDATQVSEWARGRYGVGVAFLSVDEASDFIGHLGGDKP